MGQIVGDCGAVFARRPESEGRSQAPSQEPSENAQAPKTSHFLLVRVQFLVDTVEDICKMPVVNALRSAFALL